jgi:hypothetical protein
MNYTAERLGNEAERLAQLVQDQTGEEASMESVLTYLGTDDPENLVSGLLTEGGFLQRGPQALISFIEGFTLGLVIGREEGANGEEPHAAGDPSDPRAVEAWNPDGDDSTDEWGRKTLPTDGEGEARDPFEETDESPEDEAERRSGFGGCGGTA